MVGDTNPNLTERASLLVLVPIIHSVIYWFPSDFHKEPGTLSVLSIPTGRLDLNLAMRILERCRFT